MNRATKPERVQEVAADWVARRDAGLSPSETAELEAWLTADRLHREAFEEHRAAWSSLDRPARNGCSDDVMQALQRLDQRRRRRRVTWSTVAAALLIAGLPLGSRLLDQRGDSAMPPAIATKVTVPPRELLSDGSEIELKSGAEIKVAFTAAERRVSLVRGEAHFTVAKDSARPFVVAANGIEFRALGTAFTVHSGAQVTELIVTHGSVAVEQATPEQPDTPPTSSPNQTNQTAIKTTLGVGERAVIDRRTAAIEVTKIAGEELAERLAWRAPRLEFSGATLSEVVNVLNRHVNREDHRRFVIDDPSIEHVRVSGLFRADNTAAFLDVLEEGFGITTALRGEAEIVLRGKSR